ncbi:MAG TPA: ATP-binding protein [Pyrinomonadaceae bacterium]|jgi:hypothetical protein|nr:ATP-binding protein [Pyrinomonadaceae bacterium]
MGDDELKGHSLFVGKGAVIEAKYLAPELPKFQGNPCILALPRISTRKQAIAAMQRFPHYERDPRNLPTHLRTHMVMDLLHFFQPLPIHLRLEGMISRTIRDSYLARNPLDPTYRGSLKERLECFKSGKRLDTRFEPTTSGFLLIGMSGVGKSTGMSRVLSLYPQIILHNQFQKRLYTAVQIVWLRLECPKDSSVTTLCVDFFKAVDDLLGTNYFENYGTKVRNTQELMLFMAIVAAEHHIGVLVIDEVQNLSASKSGGTAQILNFFVKLINTIGIPVVLIGTYKAIPVICSEFRLARRGSGQGDLVWDRMSFEEDWQLFTEALWDLQYVKKKCPLTPDLSFVLHDISYGITDLAIRLYLAAQVRAIETGFEKITEDLLRSAYRDDFRLVNRILEVLKSGDISPLHNLQDVFPPALQPVHEVADEGEPDTTSETDTSTIQGHKGDATNDNTGMAKQRKPPRATLKQTTNGKDNLGLVPPSIIKPSRKKVPAVYDEDDLRGVIERGMKNSPPQNAYDSLLQGGYIHSAMEYIQEKR